MGAVAAKIGTLAAGFTVVSVGTFVVVLSPQPGVLVSGGPTALAMRDIPSRYLRLYMAAAPSCPGLSWGVIAAVGKVGSDHGRSNSPGAHSGANPTGAEGPMQLLPAPFAAYAVDGKGDGRLDIYNPADAIFTAARYLCALGAGHPGQLRNALYRYSQSWTFVDTVLAWASQYVQAAPLGAQVAPCPSAGVIDCGIGPVRGVVIQTGSQAAFPWVPVGGYPDTFPWGQCTYWAAFNRVVTWKGDAWQWLANAAGQGRATSSTPIYGSVVVYRAGTGYSVLGHVGLVVGVHPSSFTVSEMNYLGLGIVDLRESPWPDAAVEGFIW